jgi:hypothetical protein
MSEAYWICGHHQEADQATPLDDRQPLDGRRFQFLAELTSQSGLQPNQLDRLDWLTDQMAGLYQREALALDGKKPIPTFLWPVLPLINHTLLQTACASLIQEETHLTALGEEIQGNSDAVLLGSPFSVGKYNLVPHARFICHFSSVWIANPLTDSLHTILSYLKKQEVDPQAVTCFAINGLIHPGTIEKPEIWQDANWLFTTPPEKGILASLNNLVERLQTTGAAFGLLASFSADHRALFTLIERI